VAVVMDWRGATWYKNCSNDMLDRIIEEHLVKGIVVTGENLMATNSEIVKKYS
jgi:(2Fe-2S) ferredoxin